LAAAFFFAGFLAAGFLAAGFFAFVPAFFFVATGNLRLFVNVTFNGTTLEL
jgi:hypothetical protein